MMHTAPTVGFMVLVPDEDFDDLVSGLSKLMVSRFGEPTRVLRLKPDCDFPGCQDKASPDPSHMDMCKPCFDFVEYGAR